MKILEGGRFQIKEMYFFSYPAVAFAFYVFFYKDDFFVN